MVSLPVRGLSRLFDCTELAHTFIIASRILGTDVIKWIHQDNDEVAEEAESNQADDNPLGDDHIFEESALLQQVYFTLIGVHAYVTEADSTSLREPQYVQLHEVVEPAESAEGGEPGKCSMDTCKTKHAAPDAQDAEACDAHLSCCLCHILVSSTTYVNR